MHNYNILHTGMVETLLKTTSCSVPMKENEAYATVYVIHHVETLPNEAYGAL